MKERGVVKQKREVTKVILFLILRAFPLIVVVWMFWRLRNVGAFLAVGPGIDVFAHGLGFLFGFFPSLALFLIRFSEKYRKSKRP